MVLIASDKMSDDRVKSIKKKIFDNSNKFDFAKDDTDVYKRQGYRR